MGTRIALWYAVSASVLLLIATTSLYWSVADGLDAEADVYLNEAIDSLHECLPKAVHPLLDADDWSFDAARVLDRDGKSLFATAHATTQLPPALAPSKVGVDHQAANGKWFRALSRQIDGKTYQVAYDRTRELDLLARYRRNMWFVLVPALTASAAIGALIARRGLRPLSHITRTAQRIGPSRLDARISTRGLPTDLFDLATTFNAMLGRLQDSFIRLERFSADIAHELRTPVHSLRNVAEVALQGYGSRDDDREALATCLESADRLSRLIEQLLFLARADDPRSELTREEVDVIHELEVVREFYGPAAFEAGVRLTVTAQGPLRCELQRTLFQRAVGNLITNALAHTAVGGRVTISAREEPSGLVITVTDSGSGIASEHLPHVFDRFYRVDAARTPGQGVGLGLAIVRSITELHGGHATVDSRLGDGTVVTLAFPKSRK